MVFQSYALFPHLNVAENIVFGLKVRRVGRAERDERLRKVADLVGLSAYLARRPAQLSGGQRQRVALARAIIAEQRLCLMDEPLSNLDARLRHEMRVEIRALQQRLGMTMVYVTHDQTEAMTMADRVILLRDGHIEQNGRPEELYERPASVFAARFIGAPPMNIIDAGGGLVGVRAEHIRVRGAGEAGHKARVAAIEYLGADTMITAEMGGNSVTARLQGRFGAGGGEPIVLDWDKAHEHRFDPGTERRLDG
jgi:sn-glycerol 3-phosphate transport system ATP-binding protein